MTWRVYLSGEIHTDWREEIIAGATGLPVEFSAPVTDHAASDDCGVAILGAEPSKFWHDHKGAKLNAIRTRTLIAKADIVVVRFGEQYKQWNAAFDAGYAAALGKSLIILQRPEHDHPLKEVDAAALAVATERITIGTLVSNTTFRNPALLARSADTVVDLSGGRLVLGLGAGDFTSEHRAYGFDFERHVGRFENALEIIVPLLRGERFSHQGHGYFVYCICCDSGRSHIDFGFDSSKYILEVYI